MYRVLIAVFFCALVCVTACGKSENKSAGKSENKSDGDLAGEYFEKRMKLQKRIVELYEYSTNKEAAAAAGMTTEQALEELRKRSREYMETMGNL